MRVPVPDCSPPFLCAKFPFGGYCCASCCPAPPVCLGVIGLMTPCFGDPLGWGSVSLLHKGVAVRYSPAFSSCSMAHLSAAAVSMSFSRSARSRRAYSRSMCLFFMWFSFNSLIGWLCNYLENPPAIAAPAANIIRPEATTGMLHEYTERESIAAQPIQTA